MAGVRSRTDTAVRVISASPDRVFAALTDSDKADRPSQAGMDCRTWQ